MATRRTLELKSKQRQELAAAFADAVRINPWLRAYYQRLRAAGKPAKVALVAVMRKLMAAVYSVAKHRRPLTLPPIFPPVAGGVVTPGT
jgi:hypothetical protein